MGTHFRFSLVFRVREWGGGVCAYHQVAANLQTQGCQDTWEYHGEKFDSYSTGEAKRVSRRRNAIMDQIVPGFLKLHPFIPQGPIRSGTFVGRKIHVSNLFQDAE